MNRTEHVRQLLANHDREKREQPQKFTGSPEADTSTEHQKGDRSLHTANDYCKTLSIDFLSTRCCGEHRFIGVHLRLS